MERVLRIVKKFLPFVGTAIFLLAVYVIHEELAGARLSELRAAFAQIGARSVALAFSVVALNYLLLAANDALSVEESGGGLPWYRTLHVSFISNALGFNLGASAVSAGAVRRRLYSALGFDAARVGKVIALAQFAFIFGPMLTVAAAFAP